MTSPITPATSSARCNRKLDPVQQACYRWSVELSEVEEAFFREGEQMSLDAEGVVAVSVIDLSSRILAAVDAEYYASIALTIEADEVSGGFEAAA